MDDKIEIPCCNLGNTPEFPEYPSDELVKEILEHVRVTGKPYTWRGHSHTKPAKGAKVLYREEFDVAERDGNGGWSPCPCCRPHSRAFKHKGKIAWFPEESVIRLIGPVCFEKLNPEGHQEALAELRARQKRDADIRSITLHLGVLEPTIDVVEAMLSIVADVERCSDDLRHAFEELKVPLWREAQDGVLRVRKTRMIDYVKADGQSGSRPDEYFESVGRIAGIAMLHKFSRSPERSLQTTLAGLRGLVGRLSGRSDLAELPDDERIWMKDALVRGRSTIEEIVQSVTERRPFLHKASIAALKDWGRHPDSQYGLRVRREGDVITLSSGRSEKRVRVGKHTERELPALPPLSNE